MAKLGISTGTIPDDGTGDSLLDGAIKINSNFSELYTLLGDGTTLTSGIVTSIVAGSNVTVSGSTGQVTINAASPKNWETTSVGIHTLSSVGIGTTNPTSILTVTGNGLFTGVVTATSFSGSGSNLTGIVTGITAGSNITVLESPSGNFIITSTATGSAGAGGTWAVTNVGIHTLKRVGIGTTNPTSSLTVSGSGLFSGIVTATIFSGSLIGNAATATYATNAGVATYASTAGVSTSVIGGIGSVTQLSVSGVSTLGNVVVGGATTQLVVNGDARVTGILTVGTASITLNGITDTLTVPNLVVTNSTTGVTASGVGITVRDGGGDLGVAQVIDFGNNLTVSLASGIATITGAAGGTNVSISDTAPGSPTAGDLWYSSLIGRGFIYYNDGSSSQWVDFAPMGAGATVISTSGSSQWVTTDVGIHTLSSVGIGTTNPTSALTVKGNTSLETLSVSGVSTFEANSSTPAVRITQTGSGDALVVQDSANPDYTPFVVTTSGTVGVGTTASLAPFTILKTPYNNNYGTLSISSPDATVSTGNTWSSLIAFQARPNNFTHLGISGENPWHTGLDPYSSYIGCYGTDNPFAISVNSEVRFKIDVTGIATFTGPTLFAKQLNVSGVSTFGANLNIKGLGDDSIIEHSNASSGDLYLLSKRGTYIRTANGEASGYFQANGAVELYYDNSKKFETLGTGVTVTGTTFTNQLVSSGVVTATSFSGSNTLKTRTIVSGVTTAIVNNGIGNTNITGYKSYGLMKVGLSTAGWLRLYTDSTSRANDVSRSVGEDPAAGSGVIAEVVTTGISTTQIISPFVMGGNLDDPADTTIYAAVTNLSGVTTSISVNLTLLQLEA